jgi:uncharacterized membrane protein
LPYPASPLATTVLISLPVPGGTTQTAVTNEEAGNFMSTGIIAGIVVAVIVIGAVIFGVTLLRRRRLRQLFGPEYDRLVGERDSRRTADDSGHVRAVVACAQAMSKRLAWLTAAVQAGQ